MAQDKELHFVLIPLMSPGHSIPMLDLARLLAQRGVVVTFVTTPANLSRIQSVVSRMKEADLPIRFLSLDFPCKEAGLPEGCESIDLLPSMSSLGDFVLATRTLEEPLRLHLRDSTPPPSCFISDFCQPWTRFVARDLGVPRFEFYCMPCFAILCEHKLYHEAREQDWDSIVVPGLPLHVEVTKAQAPGLFPGPEFAWMAEEALAAESASHGVVVNTFSELEPQFIDLYERSLGKKVWPVGPLSLSNELSSDKAERGDKSTIEVQKCTDWLDSKEPRSVVYVSFGTLVGSSLARHVELGLGLEATRRPFIWVIRDSGDRGEVEEWLALGFEERTRDRGLIIRRWAPQMTILSHPSVGGFLTHCGWNSSLEGITAGVPLLTWPGFSEQFFNERLLVDALRVAVPSGVKIPFWISKPAGADFLRREQVQNAVEMMMDGGAEGEERRRRVTDLGNLARKAMDDGGSSHQSLTLLIDEVKRCNKGGS